jgi:hypothetical protein
MDHSQPDVKHDHTTLIDPINVKYFPQAEVKQVYLTEVLLSRQYYYSILECMIVNNEMV